MVYSQGMKSLGEFHHKLLGRKAYPLNDTHKAFYSQFTTAGKRGVLFQEPQTQDFDVFLATLVCGLFLTGGNQAKVLIFVPASLESWVNAQMKSVARTMIRLRNEVGMSRAEIKGAMGCFDYISLNMHPFRFEKPPCQWVAYGLTECPGWMKPALS